MMRFDTIVDLTYIMGSLWSTRGPQVCVSLPSVVPTAVHEVVWTPKVRAPFGVTAFVDVNVIPMDTEQVLAHQTVLVEDERIIALGPVGEVKVPLDAVRIDGLGKYLIPGLTNAHDHLAHLSYNRDYWFRSLANGVTTIREVSLDFSDTTAGMILGKRRMSAREMILTPGPYPNLYVPKAKVSVADLPSIQQQGIPITVHSNFTYSFGKALTLGAHGSTEHLTEFFDTLGFRRGPGAHGSVDVPEAKLQALVLARRNAGVWSTPTMDCLEKYRNPGFLPLARRIVKALQDAGAGLLLGVDADVGVRQSTGIVHNELAALVRAGLTPYQALLTGTRNPAQYLGLLASRGTVAVGKRADLVLLAGNPLENIGHTREPAGVMIGGLWLDRAALDWRLMNPSGESGGHQLPWPVSEVAYASPGATEEQMARLLPRFQTFSALTDSVAVLGMRRENATEAKRVVLLLAAELGAIRAVLTPEQQAAFDPVARVWLREQVRRKRVVTVIGVTFIP